MANDASLLPLTHADCLSDPGWLQVGTYEVRTHQQPLNPKTHIMAQPEKHSNIFESSDMGRSLKGLVINCNWVPIKSVSFVTQRRKASKGA